jgi:putative ABC transport system permease protein
MESLIQDIRYALTALRRNKGFTAAALVTLAIGIGGGTAVFSVLNGVLMRPLPYLHAERLVRISEEHAGAISPTPRRWLSNLTYDAWSRKSQTIEAFGAYSPRQFILGFPGESLRVEGAAVTPELLSLLAASPELGRPFAGGDNDAGADDLVILSNRLWRERFGSDPKAIGQSLRIDGRPHTIVGIMPAWFYFPDRNALLWTPYVMPRVTPLGPNGSGGVSIFYALGRLAPGVLPEQAAAEGTAAARGVGPRPRAMDMLFGTGGPVTVRVRTLVDEMTSSVKPALLLLAVGVGLVLLIACANVANLILSRGVARQRELAVRAALGAGRGRIARQLLTEALVLCITGGVLGLALAWTLVRAMPLLAPANFPRLDDVRIDGGVILFAALASLAATLMTGLAPAFRSASFGLAESLHGGDGSSAGGFRSRRARRLRDGLLVAEAAFAVMLLICAILLARSFINLTHVDG